MDLNVRLEYSDGDKSNKFWECKKIASRLIGVHLYQIIYGKIGTSGRIAERLLPESEVKKKIAEKISKGYRETKPKAKTKAKPKLSRPKPVEQDVSFDFDFMEELKKL